MIVDLTAEEISFIFFCIGVTTENKLMNKEREQIEWNLKNKIKGETE